MSDTQTTYMTFYTTLQPFTADIQTRLKPDAPVALASNIGAVSNIITPSDHSFTHNEVEDVIKKVMLTLDVTDLVLKKVEEHRYIQDDDASQKWFRVCKMRLGFYMSINKMALANLRLKTTGIDVVSAGIGGINKGVYNRMNSGVLTQIQSLASVLL